MYVTQLYVKIEKALFYFSLTCLINSNFTILVFVALVVKLHQQHSAHLCKNLKDLLIKISTNNHQFSMNSVVSQ